MCLRGVAEGQWGHREPPNSQGYRRIYYSTHCRTCSLGENIMLPPPCPATVEQCYLSECLRRENHSCSPIIKTSCNNVISLFLLPQSIAFICMKEGRFMKCTLYSALLHISNTSQIFIIRLDQAAIIQRMPSIMSFLPVIWSCCNCTSGCVELQLSGHEKELRCRLRPKTSFCKDSQTSACLEMNTKELESYIYSGF